MPSEEKNLIPLSSGGLCEAEMAAPASPGRSAVTKATAGVGTTPRRWTIPPAEATPAARAPWSMGPEARVSRPTTRRVAPSAPRTVAAARPRANTNSGVRSRLATPRTPSVPNRPATAGYYGPPGGPVPLAGPATLPSAGPGELSGQPGGGDGDPHE